MLDNFKLTFWDLGTYLTVGFFSFTLILYYAISAFGFDLMFFWLNVKIILLLLLFYSLLYFSFWVCLLNHLLIIFQKS